MAKEVEPYSRAEYNRALVANALASPFNVAILAAMLIAGLLLNAFVIVLPVALVVYGIAAARTYFDEDAAKKVLERVLVELDTVRGNLVSVSASSEAANQQRLAADVHGLREEVGALAEGMSEAYEEPDAPVA